jgi:hypothetical protein
LERSNIPKRAGPQNQRAVEPRNPALTNLGNVLDLQSRART